MPIECRFETEVISKSNFHDIDYRVMRHAFDIQNELGLHYHESIYQSEVVHRCASEGMDAIVEGEIVISLDSFRKSYFVDALFQQGALYEFKAVEDLAPCHDSQLLNYLFLTGLTEGKLVNFGSSSVQNRFISTSISAEVRHSHEVLVGEWDGNSELSSKLPEIIRSIVAEWGTHLDVNLYREAIHHFLGGVEKLCVPVDVMLGGRCVGKQIMPVLDGNSILHVSSIVNRLKQYRKGLERMLCHTDLEQMQWINFCRNSIQLITLKNSPVTHSPVKK